MATEVIQTPTSDKNIINVSLSTVGETISTNGNGRSKRRTKKPMVKRHAKSYVDPMMADDWIEFRDKAPDHRAHLPTFPWEVGYREIYDEVRRKIIRTPLTLLDLIFPTEDDVGVVQVSQNIEHDDWTGWLKGLVGGHLQKVSNEKWRLMNDVLVHWGIPDISPAAPDVTAIPNPKPTMRKDKSYFVGKDGPLPIFVVEITSPSTRSKDLDDKPSFYAARGIKEYLIIDMQTPKKKDWNLIGYRLGDGPHYENLEPDDDGGFTFETVGLRFIAIGRERIDVYDSITGEKVLTPPEHRIWGEEQSTRADKAEAAAKSEMAARIQAEVQAQTEADARAAEEEARVKAEELARAEADARIAEGTARVNAEDLARAEADARAEEETARIKAEEQAKVETDARVQAEIQAKAEADARTQIEQEKLALEAELAQLRAQLGL